MPHKKMKIFDENTIKIFLGPWMLFPWTFIVTSLFLTSYKTPEMSNDYERFIFFQGSIDWGGAATFANTIALYIFFGFTASWYLVLQLEEIPNDSKLSTLIQHSSNASRSRFEPIVIC